MRVYYELFWNEGQQPGRWEKRCKCFSTEQQARIFVRRIENNVIVRNITLDTHVTK